MKFFLFIITTVFIQFSSEAYKISGEDISKINEVLDIISEKYPSKTDHDSIIVGGLDGMLQSLDSYSAYYEPDDYQFFKTNSSGTYGGIGIDYEKFNKNYRIISVTQGEPAYVSGIKKNDIITHVDDIPVSTLKIAKVSNMIRGPVGKNVKLRILRNEKEIMHFNVKRQRINPNSVLSAVYNNSVAVFKITSFNEQTYDQLLTGIRRSVLENKKIKSIILDLRGNPGGLLEQAIDILYLFLENVKIVSVKTKNNEILEEYIANDIPDVSRGLRMVVLVDKESASASEVVAAALKENKRAVLVGENTFGKATVQGFVELTSVQGAAVKITIGSYYTPNDNKIDENGISPNVQISNPAGFEPSLENLFLLNDLQMKKALQIAINTNEYDTIINGT